MTFMSTCIRHHVDIGKVYHSMCGEVALHVSSICRELQFFCAFVGLRGTWFLTIREDIVDVVGED